MLPILLSVALLALSSARSPFFGKHQEAGGGGGGLTLFVGFVDCHGIGGAGGEGGEGGGGNGDNEGPGADFARFSCSAPWEDIWNLYPSSSRLPPDRKLLALG